MVLAYAKMSFLGDRRCSNHLEELQAQAVYSNCLEYQVGLAFGQLETGADQESWLACYKCTSCMQAKQVEVASKDLHVLETSITIEGVFVGTIWACVIAAVDDIGCFVVGIDQTSYSISKEACWQIVLMWCPTLACQWFLVVASLGASMLV